jgi:hypothetical protein
MIASKNKKTLKNDERVSAERALKNFASALAKRIKAARIVLIENYCEVDISGDGALLAHAPASGNAIANMIRSSNQLKNLIAVDDAVDDAVASQNMPFVDKHNDLGSDGNTIAVVMVMKWAPEQVWVVLKTTQSL